MLTVGDAREGSLCILACFIATLSLSLELQAEPLAESLSTSREAWRLWPVARRPVPLVWPPPPPLGRRSAIIGLHLLSADCLARIALQTTRRIVASWDGCNFAVNSASLGGARRASESRPPRAIERILRSGEIRDATGRVKCSLRRQRELRFFTTNNWQFPSVLISLGMSRFKDLQSSLTNSLQTDGSNKNIMRRPKRQVGLKFVLV